MINKRMRRLRQWQKGNRLRSGWETGGGRIPFQYGFDEIVGPNVLSFNDAELVVQSHVPILGVEAKACIGSGFPCFAHFGLGSCFVNQNRKTAYVDRLFQWVEFTH